MLNSEDLINKVKIYNKFLNLEKLLTASIIRLVILIKLCVKGCLI